MKKNKFSKGYWKKRYQTNQIGWNLGAPSTPLKDYIDQLVNKSKRILIPGGGNGYEVEYLWQLGFKNIYLLDITEEPLTNFKKRVPSFPENQIILGDFFELNMAFDLIIEQTFFCALDPILRKDYVIKMNNLLSPKGKLVGLLFNIPLSKNGPPFGGNQNEYSSLFSTFFDIKVLETAHNSIQSRKDKELFFIFEKK